MTDDAESPFDRFRDFVRRVVTVPKEEIDEKEAEYKRQRQKIKDGAPGENPERAPSR